MSETPPLDCVCPPLRDLIAAQLETPDDPELDPCPVHRPEPATTAALALNDDGGLAAVISRALGAPTSREGTHDA